MATALNLKEKIYTEYFKKVTGYIQSHVENDQEREDIVSEVFLKIYAKLESYDESKASLSTWIYTITKNTVIDYYKSRKNHEVLTESILTEDSRDIDIELNNLSDALAKLDEKERDLIILHYYNGYTLKCVAKMMNISYIYAKVIHKKAISELRLLMKG